MYIGIIRTSYGIYRIIPANIGFHMIWDRRLIKWSQSIRRKAYTEVNLEQNFEQITIKIDNFYRLKVILLHFTPKKGYKFPFDKVKILIKNTLTEPPVKH